MTIKVTLPAARTRNAAPTAERRNHVWMPLPPKPVLGLIDNSKARAADLLNAVALELTRRGLIAGHFMHFKPNAAHTVSPAVRADLKARAHLIISGVGD